jgi:hypothetical protein
MRWEYRQAAGTVGYVVDTIESHWMNPKTVARLRKALHDLVDAETPKVDAKQLEKQLGAIAAKLTKAKARLLEVPADMIAVVSDQPSASCAPSKSRWNPL